MGLNDSIYASLTDAELAALELATYNGCMKLFTASTGLFDAMTKGFTWTAEYKDMAARAGVLLAAGREQSSLHDEIRAEQRDRQETVVIDGRRYPRTVTLPARDTTGDMTFEELREFEAGWGA